MNNNHYKVGVRRPDCLIFMHCLVSDWFCLVLFYLLTFIYFFYFYCCSITVAYLFSPSLHPTPPQSNPPPSPTSTLPLDNSQGGVGWGQWEEGIAGTIMKDTWTISGGMVGVGEGGGFSWGGGREGEKRHTAVIE